MLSSILLLPQLGAEQLAGAPKTQTKPLGALVPWVLGCTPVLPPQLPLSPDADQIPSPLCLEDGTPSLFPSSLKLSSGRVDVDLSL